MFAPNREQVRKFFFETWRKYRAGIPLQGLETLALEVILLHPEHHAVLDAPERNAERDYTPDMGQTNPFLHMSLHLAIEEQLTIDQPAGVRAGFDAILCKRGDRHEAMHAALECLGGMLWRSQRDAAAPDAQSYLDCLKRG